VVNIHFISKRY